MKLKREHPMVNIQQPDAAFGFKKRLFSALVLANCFVYGIAVFSLAKSWARYEQQAKITSQNITKILENNINGELTSIETALHAVKHETEGQITRGVIDRESLTRYITYLAAGMPGLLGIRATDAHGNAFYGAKKYETIVNVAERDYFVYERDNPAGGLFFSKPVLGHISKKWVINLSHRINNLDGSFAGVVFATITLDHFVSLFSTVDIGKNGFISLRAKNSGLIARYPELPNSIGSQSISRQFSNFIKEGTPTATFKARAGIDNVERLVTYRKLSGNPLLIAVGMAPEDYFSGWRKEALIQLVIICLFTAISTIFSRALLKALSQIETNAAELFKAKNELEVRVDERTANLNLANERLTSELFKRRKIESALQDSEEKYRILFDNAGDAILIFDAKGTISAANQMACSLLGYEHGESTSLTAGDIEATVGIENRAVLLAGHDNELFEAMLRCKNGATIPFEISARMVGWNDQPAIMCICRDVRERKLAETEKQHLLEQLNQAQRMESVGRLAGGIAHDFNNMLTVILGNAHLGLMEVDPHHPVYANLKEIAKSAERSTDLTRQLLAFARKQTIAPKVIDLNDTVAGMLKMLQRLIGEDILLVWLPAANLWPVKMDSSQIDQILANLCVNARDAIADVGKITIETENSVLDKGYCATHLDSLPGEYVRLVVSDNGCGMNKEMLANIFEPFFTTKSVGEGTGLGLATVFGIVKQNNGYINVNSEPNQGTTFTIYLPRHEGTAVHTDMHGSMAPISQGHETILLVEDEPAILKITLTILERQGYTVLAVNAPGEAIRIAKEYPGEINLLMTDVIMPEMNGRDLVKNLLSIKPNLKHLFMSGYTANVIAQYGVLEEDVFFIQKPFSMQGLAAKLREVLEGT